jgi:hypothetical protein
MRERRRGEGVVARAAAWHFALEERLFQVLDNRLPERLRPPDFELVKRHRARPIELGRAMVRLHGIDAPNRTRRSGGGDNKFRTLVRISLSALLRRVQLRAVGKLRIIP